MRTLRRLLSDIGSILLALSLATIVWTVAVSEENPIKREAWAEPIPIKVINQPEGTIIVGDTPAEVRLTLSAPQSSWSDLTPESCRAQVNLAQAKIGLNQADVVVECSDRNIEIVEERPSAVSIQLEHFKQTEMPARVDILDSPPFGFEVRNEEISVNPITVTVAGAEPLVNQVTQVVADFYLRDANATVERKVSLRATDAYGDNVNVKIEPSVITVKVPIVQKRGFRNLSVRVVWRGQPAAGYRISNVAVDPSIVTATGDPDTIEKIPGYLETLPVIVDGVTADVLARVALVLPESVSLLGSQAVQVAISVTPIESSLTVQREVVVHGLAPYLQAVPSPLSVDVILSGPLPKLDALRLEDVQVILNLINLDAGSYQVEPIVLQPEGIAVKSIVPAKIQVEITVRPGAEPTPTPTALAPTPTSTPRSPR
jgi:YbbR domain-containing protein